MRCTADSDAHAVAAGHCGVQSQHAADTDTALGRAVTHGNTDTQTDRQTPTTTIPSPLAKIMMTMSCKVLAAQECTT